MKTNKQMLQSNDVIDIVKTCQKISKKSKFTTQMGSGYDSVRIGTAYIRLDESEHKNVVEQVQFGYLYLHIGEDEKGCLYITNIDFFTNF